jgi:glycosyltransferase involved in cell wall biosynthesis
MTTTPQVSVIVIFLNEERFLGAAIESVLAQTFSDWELILVDDGSTDASPAIAAAAAARDPARIRAVAHPGRENRGMSASRNRGLAEARGRYIAFLDGDDVWLPEKLDQQLAVFAANPGVELVYGRTLMWRSWDGSAPDLDFRYPLGVVPDRSYPPPRLFEVLLRNRAQNPNTGNAIMTRALVERVGGFVDSFRGMFEDQVFFAKALLAAPAYVDDRLWLLYRQHEASTTARSATDWRRESAMQDVYQRHLWSYMRSLPGVPLRAWAALGLAMADRRLLDVRRRLAGLVKGENRP